MRLTQEAQVMPWTSRMISMGADTGRTGDRSGAVSDLDTITRRTHEVGAAVTPAYSHGGISGAAARFHQRVTGRIA